MPLYKDAPVPSARMGRLWTLAPVKGICVLEFGCMGHMIYAEKWRHTVGCVQGAELYTTHINEKEIILGSTTRLEKAIVSLSEEHSFRTIFLIPSSIAEVIGTDMNLLIENVQDRFPDIRLYFSHTGGFRNTFSQGMTEAMLQLVQACAVSAGRKENTFNLLGCCPDWSNWKSDAAEIIRIMQGAFGMQPQCVLPGLSSAEDIAGMGQARVNLVMRSEALSAAQWLNQKYGTAYVEGIPCGMHDTIQWIHNLSEQLNLPIDSNWLANEIRRAEQQTIACECVLSQYPVILGGHSDQVMRLQRFLRSDFEMSPEIIWSSDRKVEGIPFSSDEAMLNAPMEGLLLTPYAVVRKHGLPEQFSLSWGPSIRQEFGPMVGFKGTETLYALAVLLNPIQ